MSRDLLKRNWHYLFRKQDGQMSLGSIIFYASSFLIVLAIPITVLLLKSNQEQITTASFSPISFSSPPTFSLEVEPAEVQRGQTVHIMTSATNTNWSMLFFSPQFPTAKHPFDGENRMTVIAQGANVSNAYYKAQESGYIVGVTFQLQGAYGEFKSGDILCNWDGELFLYRKETVNPLIEVIDKNAKYRGMWDRLTTCQNSSVMRLEVR